MSKNLPYSAQTFFEGFKAQLLPLSTLSPWYHAPTSFLGLHFYQAEYLVCHGSVHKLDSFNSSVFLNFLDTPLHPLIVSLNTVSARRGKIGLRERITIILNNNNILILVIWLERKYSVVLLYCQLSAAVLSAAAVTCVCRTSLYYCMYYALKYRLCLALIVYSCACHAALPN